MEQSEIQKFYKDCNVFITGGTGFMGKVLIEKLLRSTEVTTIFVLVREKRGKNAYMRIEELFDDVLFDRLKAEQPKFRNRVEAIPGDCSIAGLGLSITDREKIMSNIHIVFHAAATVNFDEQIKLSYNINVSGTRDVIELGKQMTHLKAMIHISTAFSNCHFDKIDEKFYDILNHDNIGKLLEKMTTEESDICTPKILGKWPNTYTFTKALAESVIKDMGGGLPIGIFRPGIVISTYREPIQGWIDNLYGPTGVVAGALSGVLRVMLCDRKALADVVPVDTCVAGIISSAWHVAAKNNNERISANTPIYNYVSSPENPITWAEFIELNKIHGSDYPLLNAIWSVQMLCTSNIHLSAFFRVILHTFPALLIDLGLVISGQKPRLLKTYKKIHKLQDVLSHFSQRSWRFSNRNTISMWQSLNRTDQELFPFSMTTVQWLLYYRRYIKGLRVYLMKDPETTLHSARLKEQRFNTLNTIFKTVAIFCACNLVSSMFSKILVSLF